MSCFVRERGARWASIRTARLCQPARTPCCVPSRSPPSASALLRLGSDAGLRREIGERGFTTAQEFLAAFDPLRPGCLVLDVRMPGLEGTEVLTRARRVFPDLQVVLMTAYASVEDAVEAIKLGASDYVTKPLDLEDLVSRVKRLLDSVEGLTREQAERQDLIPGDALVREFIGGSTIRIPHNL
jgi:DNA-binding NtrC family response regulator